MVAKADPNLWLTEDAEFEVVITRRNNLTGRPEPATGFDNVEFRIAATPGGPAIGTLTFPATERGATGRYFAVADTARLVSQLNATDYPNNRAVWLVCWRPGDIQGRSWRKVIRRQRQGDG